MHRFVDALVNGAGFVKGSRNLAGGGSADFTLLRHLGNLGFTWAANLLFDVSASATSATATAPSGARTSTASL